ncbi:MAG: formate--tetrahydrofolate ligase [Pseudomonadales bacterium]|jgi:formate--tetrahydrofolate ligase|nr:formate--tetrahydrofolate ligase [Gammaproteobacteria bacterium]MDP6026518.1 formate--tetrahydrofolate ligase [Pseudomonadales bacterium]MDP6317180.1 formate--tetrahydrofolate ligase [Pseudomonadales bacterium]MDP7314030.1 formate--tetrahydrofolate ligase [Pseudomonadales bacterium]MDP7575513.1 formate--tetrahydrofolate ligase [Pseudomonadales bacterium]|tara:strand:+ start:1800 stop:3476 length:1677 start_codon:yes stop_codon:yes gene_type:complete
MPNRKSDIEIARDSNPKPIVEIGAELNIPAASIHQYGLYKAKIDYAFLNSLEEKPDGKLILVTAISPTPAGEGKTTTTVGLGDALNRLGKKTTICLREPSLGPCFGMKGGAAGGGYAQVVPMEDINLHFTGDLHAITTAHNLLAALVDNHIHWHNSNGIDSRRIIWRRVADINDRTLRRINTGLGGTANGIPRETGFDLTVASEVMAIFCLSENIMDLQKRLAKIIVGYTRDREPITAEKLKADGPMSAILRDALMPNLVQTLENNPAIIHGGPFANIAHGCNSVIATKTALKMSEYVVTEAGFGADLGAEKFFNIKCRKADLKPDAAVIVATVRALKMHGGTSKGSLEKENIVAVQKGITNLARHVRNVGKFGVPIVVAINRFSTDTDRELKVIKEMCAELGVKAVEATHWADGGVGAENLADNVIQLVESGASQFRTLYDDKLTLWEKTEEIARNIYGASEIIADKAVRNQFQRYQKNYGHFPICIAKTQYSFSTDPNLMGAPNHHVVPVRELRLCAGAGFLVVICGDILTMPGLPERPSAHDIHVNEDGMIEGLF